MSARWIAPIVEGHGEVLAVPILLRRIWKEHLQLEDIDVAKPIRQPRNKLVKEAELARAIELAALKLAQSGATKQSGLVLLMIDADRDPACELAPQMLELAKKARADLRIACVLPSPEFETWFVAAAQSLQSHVPLENPAALPQNPERDRHGKGWVQTRFAGARYSETIDQPKLTSSMDLDACRLRSPSFDKLVRELQTFATTSSNDA